VNKMGEAKAFSVWCFSATLDRVKASRREASIEGSGIEPHKPKEMKQVASGAAFFTFAEVSGMASIQNMTPSHAYARAKEALRQLRESTDAHGESNKEALLDEALGHLDSITPRARNRALRALFQTACNVHLQVSRLALVASHQGEHFADMQSYMSIALSIASLAVAHYGVFELWYKSYRLVRECRGASPPQRISMALTNQQREMMFVLGIACFTVCVSLHAIATMVMASWCPQSVWNVPLSWNLMDGCLTLPN
jgi:hypothetical protein